MGKLVERKGGEVEVVTLPASHAPSYDTPDASISLPSPCAKSSFHPPIYLSPFSNVNIPLKSVIDWLIIWGRRKEGGGGRRILPGHASFHLSSRPGISTHWS